MSEYHFGTLEWAGNQWKLKEHYYYPQTPWPDNFSIDLINENIVPKFHINDSVVFYYNFGRGRKLFHGRIKRIVLGWYLRPTIEEFYDAESMYYIIHNESGHDCYVQLKDIRRI